MNSPIENQELMSPESIDAAVAAELEALTFASDASNVDDELVFEVLAQRCPPGVPTVGDQ